MRFLFLTRAPKKAVCGCKYHEVAEHLFSPQALCEKMDITLVSVC